MTPATRLGSNRKGGGGRGQAHAWAGRGCHTDGAVSTPRPKTTPGWSRPRGERHTRGTRVEGSGARVGAHRQGAARGSARRVCAWRTKRSRAQQPKKTRWRVWQNKEQEQPATSVCCWIINHSCVNGVQRFVSSLSCDRTLSIHPPFNPEKPAQNSVCNERVNVAG